MIKPTVSVILPVRNEAACIEGSLLSILAQDYPANQLEILVADGMSSDNTRQIINELAAKYPQNSIRVLNNPGKIVPTGINNALRQARGEIIIRVDGHTLLAPDYVRQCVDALQRTQAENVGGKMSAVGSTPFGRAVAAATSSPFGVGGARFHYSEAEEWVDTVYMGAWPRRVFERIGLFDEELVRDQDDEFNYRLRAAGGKIRLCPQIRSEYTVRSNPQALWRQYFQYGYWKVRVLQKHPRQMSPRQFVPPLFVLGLLCSLLAAASPILRPLSPLVPAAYLLANLSASLWTAARRGWRALPLLPPAFAILHVSYGSGFLVGLLKFSTRWQDKTGKTPQWSLDS